MGPGIFQKDIKTYQHVPCGVKIESGTYNAAQDRPELAKRDSRSAKIVSKSPKMCSKRNHDDPGEPQAAPKGGLGGLSMGQVSPRRCPGQ